MIKHFLLSAAAVLIATPVAVRAQEPASILESKPASTLVNEIIELKPVKGYHFNPEAPQECGGLVAYEVLPMRLRCQFQKEGEAAVLVSVCNDAKTMCRQEDFKVAVKGFSKTAAAKLSAIPKNGKRAPEGFIDNEPSRALALAVKEKKLLFIHFYAIWCPPCNQLEEYAYPDLAFKTASADFITIGLDSDAPVSFDWKARFKIGGYPTIIVADSKLQEIGRIVGYRPGSALAKFMASMKNMKDEPVNTAAKMVTVGGLKATEARKLRVASWYSERAEFDKVEKTLKGLTSKEALKISLLARQERARREEDSVAHLAATKELAVAFPDVPDFLFWASELAGNDKNSISALRESVQRLVPALLNSPDLGEDGFTVADVLYGQASFYETIGSTEEAKALWSKAADAYAAQVKASPMQNPRAANFSLMDALSAAGRKGEALALGKKMTEAYPEEFTFNYAYASELKDDKSRLPEAYTYAVKALDAAYGDNRLRAARLKADIENLSGRASDALKTIDAAIAETVLPKSTAVRTGRYLRDLRNLRAKIKKD